MAVDQRGRRERQVSDSHSRTEEAGRARLTSLPCWSTMAQARWVALLSLRRLSSPDGALQVPVSNVGDKRCAFVAGA